MPYLVALAVVLLVGGGVTVVSNNSLPGDTLYPIKGASETVRTVLNVSEKGEAELSASLSVERLKEIERLYHQDRLNVEIFEELKDEFNAYLDETLVITSVMGQKQDFKAAAAVLLDLESNLSAHSEIITTIASRASTSQNDEHALVSFSQDLSESLGKVEAMRIMFEDEIVKEMVANNKSVDAHAQVRKSLSEVARTQAEGEIGNIKGEFADKNKEVLSKRLEFSQTAYEFGEVELSAGNFSSAALWYTMTIKITDSTRIMAETVSDTNLELQQNISVDQTELEIEGVFHPEIFSDDTYEANGMIDVKTGIETEVEIDADTQNAREGVDEGEPEINAEMNVDTQLDVEEDASVRAEDVVVDSLVGLSGQSSMETSVITELNVL